ncbi:MAG: hypothetical protein QGI75_07790 [Phycisphaerales bacterium]|jgi:hypothetical protein|nr:hypothetical protein [Phycisphaerales bacterium]MDP6987297.1 hypothetical protein [Phycisphaerales bacterium]
MFDALDTRRMLIVAIATFGLSATTSVQAGDELGGCPENTDCYDVTTVFVGEYGYGGGGSDIEYYGTHSGLSGWAVGTTACNLGNIVAPWDGGTRAAPVIGQNVYRYKDGRFEQIGLSWLKHSFCAVSEPGCGSCQSTGCSTLGIGCADTYWADLNANIDAPRSEINATTGEYNYPFTNSPSGPSTIRARIQLLPDDINPSENAGAQYWFEGQYVVTPRIDSNGEYVEPGESVWGVHLNNASSRAVRFTSTSNCVGISVLPGATDHTVPAVMRWSDVDSNATVVEVLTDEYGEGGAGIVDGLLHVGHAATDNGNGTHHYEFLVHNQVSHRSVGSFSVPVPDCVTLTNVEARLPIYHSGETIDNAPWNWEHSDGVLTFWTDAHTSENNMTGAAIRWGTLANFRFDADAAPTDGDLTLGLWRPGPGAASYDVAVKVPDCEGCPEDLNGDGVIDVNDLLMCVGGFGTPAGDVDGDGIGGVNDILMLIAAFGSTC